MARRKSAAPFYIGGIAVLAVIFGAVAFLQKEDIDGKTGCPKSGPKSTTVVVIDTSDPLSLAQQKGFRKFVETLVTPPKPDEVVTANSDSANYVAKGHLLVAYKIMTDERAEPELLFRRCNPGNPNDRTIKDSLTEGKILSILKWDEFQKKLLDAFPMAMLEQTAPTSPIIETLKYVRITEFPSPAQLKSSGQNAGSVFIISDMLQNSDKLSHFGDLPPTADVPSQFALDLTGIDIGIRYLKVDRYAHLQYGTRPHIKWWREFFAIAGAPLNKPLDVW